MNSSHSTAVAQAMPRSTGHSAAMIPAMPQRTGTLGSRALTVPVIVIAIVLGISALRFGQGFIVPLVLGVLVAYALDPLVRALRRLGVCRWLAAGVVVGGLMITLAALTYALGDTVASAINQLPQATGRLRTALGTIDADGAGPLGALARAADDLEAVASGAAGLQTVDAGSTQPLVLRLRESLLLRSMTLLGMTSTVFLIVLFVYFLLAADDLFKRKIVGLAGPSLSRRRAIAVAIDDINRSVERFLSVIVSMNALVALCTWGAFHTIGLANAGALAIMAGLLNSIPYLGSAVAAIVFFLAALLQFDSFTMAIVTAGVFIAITTIESTLVTPWLLGRTVRMNNVAVFGGLLFWGWLWGPWGMALSFPIMVVIKTVSDRIDPLRPLGEMLGR